MVKKTLYRQQACFNDMDAAVASVQRQELQLERCCERSGQQEKALRASEGELRRLEQRLEGLTALREEDLKAVEAERLLLQERVEEAKGSGSKGMW